MNIEEETKLSKKKLLINLEKSKKKYAKYINTNIRPDKNNLGYKKIIYIIRKNFFQNYVYIKIEVLT